jgi:hypothetical protein
MEIVAFDTDDRADGDTTINNGKAKITWISKGLLPTAIKMHDTAPNGAMYSYINSNARAYLLNNINPLIPETVMNNIVTVKKYFQNYTGGSSTSEESANLDTWIPSGKEVGLDIPRESHGVTYSGKFDSLESRVKKERGNSSVWTLRSVYSKSQYYAVRNTGSMGYTSTTGITHIPLGFCT